MLKTCFKVPLVTTENLVAMAVAVLKLYNGIDGQKTFGQL